MSEKPTYQELENRVKELEGSLLSTQKTERELENYKNLISQVEDLVYICDAKANVLFVNKVFEKLTHRKCEEFIGKSFAPLFDDKNLKIAIDNYTRTLEGENPQFEAKFKDTGVLCEYKNIPLRDEKLNIIGVMGIARDITERKQMDKALKDAHDGLEQQVMIRTNELTNLNKYLKLEIKERQRAEETLQKKTIFLDKIIDSSSLSMWISDDKGTAIKTNPACLDFFGATEKEVIGKYNLFQDTVIEDKGFMPVIKDVFEKGKTSEIIIDYDFGEVDHVDVANATHKILKSVFTPVLDNNGRVSNVIVQAIDLTDIKNIENELRESLEKFQQIAETVREAFWIGSPDWKKVHYVSPAYEEIWGKSCQSLIDNPTSWMDAVHQEDRDSVQNAIEQKVRGNLTPPEFPEYRVIRSDGSTRWILARAFPIYDDKNQVSRIVGIAEDITERKQAEEKYRLLVENADDLITQVDIDGNFTFVNKAAEKYFGTNATTAIGQSAFTFIHKDDQEDTRKIFEECISQKKTKSVFENRQVSKNGKIHHMIWDSTFNYDHEGKLASVDGIGKDISQLRETEINLKREKERAQKYLDVAGVMFVALNTQGQITLINQQGAKLLKVTEQEALGKNWFDHYLPEYLKKEVWSVFEKLMRGETEPVEYYDNTILTSDGEERFISFHNTILTSDKGTIEGVLFSGEDITDRKRTEAERRKLEMQLRQSHKMEAIGTLAGGIAHDFNNILTAIIGFAELANLEMPPSLPAKEYIDEVLMASNRAKSLVKHILSFSRKEASKCVPVQINLVTKEALKLLRASIPSTIAIEENIDPDCGYISADPTQIHQILMNLCTNASQAMEDGGGILTVKTYLKELSEDKLPNRPNMNPGTYVVLTVCDNGPGIDPQFINRIFDPYFTTKETGKGSGMGLAVAHGIAKRFGGSIEVENNFGGGICFHVYFPKIEQEEVEKNIISEMESMITGGAESILFVDDEQSIVTLNEKRLKKLGYKITGKTSSIDALEIFSSTPDSFDLVITDQTMPNMTGEQLAKEILAIRPNIPIILCTGYSSAIDMNKAQEIGVAAYIMKPIHYDELDKVIRQLLKAS